VASVAVLGSACGTENSNGSGTAGQNQPTAASTAKPSEAEPTESSPKLNTPGGSTGTTSEPPTSSASSAPGNPSPESFEDTLLKVIKAGQGNLIDIAVTNNATCSQKKGETLELSKLTGGWEPSPYATVTGETESPTQQPDSYSATLHEADGDPMADWSFHCGGQAIGYHTVQFVEVGSDKPQVTEQVMITVTP
jgi:hypothetical protein